MPDALWGKTVCLYDGMDVKLKQLDRGNIADHRLRARWNLELADTGEVQGTLELMLSGGWPYVIFGCQGYSLDMSSITHLYPPSGCKVERRGSLRKTKRVNHHISCYRDVGNHKR